MGGSSRLGEMNGIGMREMNLFNCNSRCPLLVD